MLHLKSLHGMKINRLIKLSAIALSILLLVWACQGNVSQQIGSNGNTTSECRFVKHSLGETCVPLNPQRVVVLDVLDNVLALGIKPVGATTADSGNFRTNLPEQTQEIAKVGLIYQPNLESILRLQPDLILGIDWQQEVYDKLSKIAPTVLAPSSDRINWKEWFQTYAEALGKSSEGKKILNEYDNRIKSFQQQIGEKRSQTKVSVVMFWDGVRIYMKKSFSGGILSDLGLPRPPEQDKDKVNEDISLELIPKMAGDAIFLMIGDRTPELDRFTNHPLWSQLEAVKQGKVYQVKADTWLAGYSPVAANSVLDDLFKYLVKKSDTS
jgi:iron complex transport system substrate-binding protein